MSTAVTICAILVDAFWPQWLWKVGQTGDESTWNSPQA